MRKFGLIGNPLTHSFSKKYFADKFERESITDCVYELYPLQHIGELPQLIKSEPDLVGLNITIPYKKQVIALLNVSSNVVQQVQACNCISFINGKLYGYNTDVTGFEMTFVPHLKNHHKKALILGTGGAASAVEFTLKKLGINCLFVSRNKATGLNAILYNDVDEQIITEHNVIINTTPLGTYPATDSYPEIPYRYLTPKHYLYDLVYNPPKTLFLEKGAEYGATIENGANMLVIQADESWKLWNNNQFAQ